MSLFKAREWWSTKLGDDEEFDKGCLCLANIDNDSEGESKLCVGSFSGMLRIFKPNQRDYHVDDLLLESDLGAPILQLASGSLSVSARGAALAVLHPRKLIVYTVSSAGAQAAGGGSYWTLNKTYEHTLTRTACNMVVGSFGGVSGKDFVCVQSMDGELSFFEQDSLAFSRFLSNFLLPGPLCYIPKLDSFVTFSSQLEVGMYRYRVLAASNASSSKTDQDSMKENSANDESADASKSALTKEKRPQTDWSFNVGEFVVDIQVGRMSKALSPTDVEIIVAAERAIFVLHAESGECVLQKRLDYFVSSLCVYSPGYQDGTHNLIVGTHNSTLMVYRDLALVWAATTTSIAVAVRVDTFAKMPGLISTLDDAGSLVIQYLGTDPPTSGVTSVDSSKEPNYEEMDDEHRRLLNVIREATSDSRVEPTERLMIRAQVPTSLDASGHDGEMRQPQENADMYAATVTARVFINYRGGDSIENIVLTVSVPPPFTVNQEQVMLQSLHGRAQTPAIVPLTFKLAGNEVVSSKVATVMATYTTPFGEPRSASAELVLPLCLIARVVSPLKNATHKLTIDCSRMPPPLALLFEDMLQQQATFNPEQSSSSSHILTFMYHNGIDVTILVSKNAGRIRLQSGEFDALWPILHELTERLYLYFKSMDNGAAGEEPFSISFSEAIPFTEVFDIIDQHLECRQRMSEISKTLSEGAHQFRSIQKRLLLRFKDRNPAPLQHLDTLLDETYQQLRVVGDEMEEKQNELKQLQNRLSAAINILNHVVKFKFDLDESSFSVLETHISPNVIDNSEVGWEEMTEASVTYLLRTVMAKSSKDSAAAVPQSMNPLSDTVKLKKHIQLVCDRLSKGVKLTKKEKRKDPAEDPAADPEAAAVPADPSPSE